MTTDNTDRSVLILGPQQLVIDDTVLGLRDLGYTPRQQTTSPTSPAATTSSTSTSSCSADRSPGAQSGAHRTDRRDQPTRHLVEGLAGIPG